MEIKRGYVKWEENGVFHKEPLYKHPELLAEASVEDQIRAEEVRRLNEAAEEFYLEREETEEVSAEEVLEALKAAPEDVLTADQLLAEPYEITADHIINGSIGAQEIKPAAVLISDNSVTAEELDANAVTPAKLKNDNSNNDGDSD